MSKTIEIASIHKCTIVTKVKGQGVTVQFKDRGDVGIALVDNDTAGALLSIGLPEYWKPTVNADAGADTSETTGATTTTPGEAPPAFANAKAAIAKVKEAATLEELDALLEGEERKSVLDEGAKRSKELTK